MKPEMVKEKYDEIMKGLDSIDKKQTKKLNKAIAKIEKKFTKKNKPLLEELRALQDLCGHEYTTIGYREYKCKLCGKVISKHEKSLEELSSEVLKSLMAFGNVDNKSIDELTGAGQEIIDAVFGKFKKDTK